MGDLKDGEVIAASGGGLELIHHRPSGKWYIRDLDENTTSAPLHHTLVSCILGRPANLLDMRLCCPTPTDPEAVKLEWS